MTRIKVPELRRKFDLLRSYSVLKSREELAAAFNQSWKTLDWWARGDASRDGDQLPAAALPILLKLFADIVSSERPADRLQELVLGPADRLEEELRVPAHSLTDLIASEARLGVARLIRKDDLSLIEYEDEADTKDPKLFIGEWFRIEFPRPPPCRYAVVLQNAQQVWSMIDCSLSSDPFAILVPDADVDGTPRHMRERRDLGRHQFVCLTAPVPFPARLHGLRHDQSLPDRAALDSLVDFFRGLPVSQRGCFLLVVTVEPRAGAHGGNG